MYHKYAQLRDAAGLTDYKVAKDTGIPKSTFSDWKAGRSKPKVDKLLKIANYFGVPVEELITEPAEVG
ncbi:MAG: helix-turn-helix transcriptional regulator [Eubacterium sp.]|nr:helix-turn-helix transcriptional regulator [Eubacterium sp.]